MRRAVFILLTVCLVLCFIDALALDYSMYEIRNRFTMDVNLLRDGEFVAETWEDRYGDVRNNWHVTWWKDDHILREVDYDPLGPIRYWAAPHMNGTCGILETSAKKLSDGSSAGAAVTLYDWTDKGLTNPRPIAEGVTEVRAAFGGFSVWKKETREIGIYDDSGKLLFEMSDAENMPIRLAFDHLGNLWFSTTIYGKTYEENTYILRQICGGMIVWEKKLPFAPAVFPDEKGGIYTAEHVGTGSYKSIEITHIDAAGNKVMTKLMKADKVVLGCGILVKPETDELILAGTAVANSRKVYKVYRIVVDANDWTIKKSDIRTMNYYNDYTLYVARDLDGNCYTFASGIDELDAGNINPVLVPFDVLDKTDNPGIRLQ